QHPSFARGGGLMVRQRYQVPHTSETPCTEDRSYISTIPAIKVVSNTTHKRSAGWGACLPSE
ncbi:MAG: hypothetical protein ACE5QV_05000, partial [Fidelibacterota bacterium]